jgi:serine/threonine-protein kinase
MRSREPESRDAKTPPEPGGKGGEVRADEEPTLASPASGGAAAERSSGPSRSGGHFIPGHLLAGRYRIVTLLGRGGMGEVYRAEDLELGETVALKFLPERLDDDPERLARLREEVRLARRIAHPHVCRVFDLGAADGRHFLSMEFVDGEDLASLLTRIGRLPEDKAAQLGRQVCSGLAAAHEEGVLHRDLKPANVMVDGRGRARIMDFGLAALRGAVDAHRIPEGTPAYQAPEQRAGREVTRRSDLWALGAILHEMLTGERPGRVGEPSSASSASSLQQRADPATEGVIRRCLEEDPARRPASALAVAAALPGGDPVAAALAAGETPSPEAVAMADTGESLRPAVAWGGLALFVAGLAGLVLLAERVQPLRIVGLDLPPEVLEERARAILDLVGHDAPAVDDLYTFKTDLDALAEAGMEGASWSRLREDLRDGHPPLLTFSYRQSPGHLVPLDAGSTDWLEDPPSTHPGMAQVTLDTRGELLFLLAMPPERAEPSGAAGPTDWTALLEAAATDPTTLEPVEPTWQPPVSWDERAAWEGRYHRSDREVRLEAAALRGRPVALKVFDSAEPAAPWGALDGFARYAGPWLLGMNVVALIVIVLLARRNLRLGRGDRRGAVRLALYLAALGFLTRLLGAHHLPAFFELGIVQAGVRTALTTSVLLALLYLALEPYLRRLWPRMLVSWVRLLEGRFRDPEVGRAVLAGALLGVISPLLWIAAQELSDTPGTASAPPGFWLWELDALRGGRAALAQVLAMHLAVIMEALFWVLVLLVARLALRRTWLALPVAAAFWCLGGGYAIPTVPQLVTFALVAALVSAVLFRVGLLAVMVAFWINALVWHLPLTFDLSAWYAPVSLLALGLALATCLWGFLASVGARPLVSEALLEGTATAQPPQ